jgi:hypothetical protein
LAQQAGRLRSHSGRPRFIFCLADHFEPSIVPGDGRARAAGHEQERRLEQWCRELPRALDPWRDSDGRPFYHTYFYPAEQYDRGLVERLAEHCKAGWGEVEIHLHHGMDEPDTYESTKRQLLEFRNTLAGHGCLSQWDGAGEPRYAFVHGNFALANSAGNHYCGVDAEIQILADTGCYADFTLPAAPAPGQVSKINSLYECGLPLTRVSAHSRGRDLRRGRAPRVFPILVQGPLGLDFSRRKWGMPKPAIENAEVTTKHPPTMKRLRLWERAGITVEGRNDWVFVKLHCHGMDPRDVDAMWGNAMKNFLRELTNGAKIAEGYEVHFTTAREMTNIILAACDGREGNPGEYREYRLKSIRKDRQQAGRDRAETVSVQSESKCVE